MKRIEFFVSTRPEPQGSARAFVIGGKARITSSNTKLKPYRTDVAMCAMAAIAEGQTIDHHGIAFDKHVPVRLTVDFTFRKPASVPKHRTMPVVKPDLDKLIRATKDALTGIVYADDAQVVTVHATKRYGGIEGVKIVAELE